MLREVNMASEEYERLKQALQKSATEEARKAAAEAMRRYLEKQGKGSKPRLVSLGLRKTYPHDIPLDKVADELERNPDFFELMKRVVK